MFTDALLAGLRVLPAWANVLVLAMVVVGVVVIWVIRRAKDFSPQDSGDRLALWRLWFGYLRQRRENRQERWLVRQDMRAKLRVVRAENRASRRPRG